MSIFSYHREQGFTELDEHPITIKEAEHLAHRWINTWNQGDIAAFMQLHDEDVELISSLALRMFPESHGKITDKKLLRAYWELVQDRMPELQFAVDKVCLFENKIVLYYSTPQQSHKAIAILTINSENHLIRKVEVSYV
ncbi:MAG: nuclear transport factor 2 family protein [Chitinophagaceae bacterium]|nr:nuclear transport factor 2 family protein [Chitinophagaceae bacterium]